MANNIKNTPDEMDYLNYKLQLAQEEYDEFIDLICNALKIENLPDTCNVKFRQNIDIIPKSKINFS